MSLSAFSQGEYSLEAPVPPSIPIGFTPSSKLQSNNRHLAAKPSVFDAQYIRTPLILLFPSADVEAISDAPKL